MTPSTDLANAAEWTSHGPLSPEFSLSPEFPGQSDTGASAATAWRAILHGVMGLLQLESSLIDEARAGFARHLRPDVVRQAEVTSFLEGLRSERSSHQVHLIHYLGMHFGDHAVWSIPATASHWVASWVAQGVGMLLSRMPALAVVILMCIEQASQQLYEGLAQVARHSGQLELMGQLLHMRARSTRNLMGLQHLMDVTPELSLPGRLLARTSMALWNLRVLRPVTLQIEAVSHQTDFALAPDGEWTRDLFQQPLLNALASTSEPRAAYQPVRIPRC